MKHLLLPIAAALLLLASCSKKQDEVSLESKLPVNTWTINSDTFYANKAFRINADQEFIQAVYYNGIKFYVIGIVFQKIMRENGSYPISNTVIDSNHVRVYTQSDDSSISTRPYAEYVATGYDNKKVEVRVDKDSDIIRLTVPPIWARATYGSDSVIISANLIFFK